MTADSAQQLIAAARTGDLALAQKLLATGADWRAQKEECLYQALKNDHRDIVKLFLAEALAADKKTPQEIDEGLHIKELEELDKHLIQMNPLSLLSLAIRHNSDGLFRYVLKNHPDEVRDFGLGYAQSARQTRFIAEILDTGADVGVVPPWWLYQLVIKQDLKTVTEMLDHGLDPNKAYETTSGYLHCLQAASYIKDHALREEFYTRLIGAGADIRTATFRPVQQLMYNGLPEVFNLYERCDPGSGMMALLGNGAFFFAAFNVRQEAAERFPLLKNHEGVIAALADKDPERFRRWLETSGADLAADDGFILKLAVASPQAETAVPLLLQKGADPAAQKDPPRQIAALLGKTALTEMLAQHEALLLQKNTVAEKQRRLKQRAQPFKFKP